MIARRPSVFIYTHKADPGLVKEICAGIEENGVFYEIFERNAVDLQMLAHDAAADSITGSGIGINEKGIALQMRGLPFGKNVETCQHPDGQTARRLGQNSARAVKKMPLL